MSCVRYGVHLAAVSSAYLLRWLVKLDATWAVHNAQLREVTGVAPVIDGLYVRAGFSFCVGLCVAAASLC